MGYNLYVVKRGNWYEPDNRFGQEEWGRLTESGPLPDWVYFDDGVISVKSPTKEQVVTCVRFAKTHGWFVQGDDGETYDEDGAPLRASAIRPGLLSTILKPLRHHKVQSYWVGPEAYREFRAGRRLATIGVKSPPEYDLAEAR